MASTSTRTATYQPPRTTAWAGEPLAIAGVTVLGIALVLAIDRFDGFEAEGTITAPVVLGAIACLAVILAGPIPCVAAIGALTAAGYVPSLGQFGGVDVTLADVFLVGLVGWWAWTTMGRAQRVLPPRQPVAFGQVAVLLFLAYVGLTIFHVADWDPSRVEDSVISWMSLVQTALLAWLAASVIESKRDVWVVLGAVALGGLVAVVVGALSGEPLAERTSGTLGPNALGLVSAILLVLGAFAIRGNAGYRIVLVAAGIVGLLLAKSVGAIVAVGVALAVGMSVASGRGASQRLTRIAVAVVLAGLLVFGVVQFVRPEVVPGSEGFRSSSAAHRIVVGAAGVEIFERNPVIGVGWRGSDAPQMIGDREVVAEVHKRFPDARPIFFPDVQPTSVHNTYVQILADLGIVGFALFAGLILVIGFRIRALLRRLGRQSDLWSPALACALCLVVVLVWYNDNPLYGGQPETVLPALFVGILAGVARPVSTVLGRRGSAGTPIAAPRKVRPTALRPAPAASAEAPAPVDQGRVAGRDRPVIWPGAGRRIAAGAMMVATAGAIGLLAGRWTAQDDATLSTRAGPSPAAVEFRATLRDEVKILAARRRAGLQDLRTARTPEAQAQAGESLTLMHERSATAIAKARAPAPARPAKQRVVAALERLSRAYERLALAAAERNPAAYASAQQAVQRVEANLKGHVSEVIQTSAAR